MKILIYDEVQDATVIPSENLRTPALTEKYTLPSWGLYFDIFFDGEVTINCAGIGFSTSPNITFFPSTGGTEAFSYTESGLYVFSKEYTVTFVRVAMATLGETFGRIAFGYAHDIPISPMREPGFFTTTEVRRTLSGQVVPNAQGYSGRNIQVEAKYRITENVYNDFERAYASQISRGYPLFIDFDCDAGLPIRRIYATIDSGLTFQSSVRDFLYSKKFKFTEAF